MSDIIILFVNIQPFYFCRKYPFLYCNFLLLAMRHDFFCKSNDLFAKLKTKPGYDRA